MKTIPSRRGHLVPGTHRLTWRSLRRHFAFNEHRDSMADRVRLLVDGLALRFGFAGRVYIGGSFVSKKVRPADVDVALDCSDMSADGYAALKRAVVAEYLGWHKHYRVDAYLIHPSLPDDIRGTLRQHRVASGSPEAYKGLVVIPRAVRTCRW